MKKQRLVIGDNWRIRGVVSLDGVGMKGLCEMVTFNLRPERRKEGWKEGRKDPAKSLLDSILD